MAGAPARLMAQVSDRTPKSATDANRMRDNVVARHEYDANARALLNPKFRDALDHYEAGSGPQLTAAWGEFIAADATPFIALHFDLPANPTLQHGEPVTFFGAVDDADGHRIATYNETLPVQLSFDGFFVERSLVVPLKKASGTFGVARRSEIMAMMRVAFDPEDIAPATAGVSRLIVSRDVYILKTAQKPFSPQRHRVLSSLCLCGDLVWASSRESRAGTAARSVRPTPLSGPPLSAVATPLKGVPGHYGLGNAIDVSKLAAGDYKLRVVITDLIAKQAYRRETTLHIRD
ncbi:MAG TPA: hypothetical protein VGA10_04305 [Thermoanaerobaculia bacterium]